MFGELSRHHAHHCASNASKLPPRCSLQRCQVAHNLPRVSPVGIDQDAHRLISRNPLGPRNLSSRSPDMYPHMPNRSQRLNGRETCPRISLRPGRANDGSANCLFIQLHTVVHPAAYICWQFVGSRRHSHCIGHSCAGRHMPCTQVCLRTRRVF